MSGVSKTIVTKSELQMLLDTLVRHCLQQSSIVRWLEIMIYIIVYWSWKALINYAQDQNKNALYIKSMLQIDNEELKIFWGFNLNYFYKVSQGRHNLTYLRRWTLQNDLCSLGNQPV